MDDTILEYNTETDKVIERVSDKSLYLIEKVSLVQAGHHTKYIFKCALGTNVFTGGFNWVVNIYNRDWNLISTINMYLDVLTVTPGGKLLLVYNNRMHEYSQDGTLIKELLDGYKFNELQGITWSGGYLWVLEGNPCCMKIFVSN